MEAKKTSWQQRMKEKVVALQDRCNVYYEANYRARAEVRGNNLEVYAGPASLEGSEETTPCYDTQRLREIILKLPV